MPGQAPPPPTSTAARPPVPPASSTPVVPGVLVCLVRHLDARSGPAAAHQHRAEVPQPGLPHSWALVPLIPALTTNFACNSPATISNLEFTTLEFQRFLTSSKPHPIELHATLMGQALMPPNVHQHTPASYPDRAILHRHLGQDVPCMSALRVDETGCARG